MVVVYDSLRITLSVRLWVWVSCRLVEGAQAEVYAVVVLFTSFVHAPEAGDRVLPLFWSTFVNSRLGYTVKW
jgi:hypothetical protein